MRRRATSALEFAAPDDIDQIDALGRSRIGRDHVPERVLSRRVERQPRCVALRRDDHGHPVAVSVVYALTASATAAIEAGRIVNGSMLTLPDLASTDEGTSLYIGAVVSVPHRGPIAVSLLWRHLVTLFPAHPHIDVLFARAATDRGARLLQRCRFTRLEVESEIQARRVDPALRQALGRGGEIGPSAVSAIRG